MNHPSQKRESSLPLGMKVSQVISRNTFNQFHRDPPEATCAIETNNYFENSMRTVHATQTMERPSPSDIAFKKPKIPTMIHVPRSPTNKQSIDLPNKYSHMMDIFKERSSMLQKSLCGSLNKSRVTKKASTYQQLHNINKNTSNSQSNLLNFFRLYGSSKKACEDISEKNQSANELNHTGCDGESFYFTPNVQNDSSVSPFEFSDSPSYLSSANEPYLEMFDTGKLSADELESPGNMDEVFSPSNGIQDSITDSSLSSLDYFGSNNTPDLASKLVCNEKTYSMQYRDHENWFETNRDDNERANIKTENKHELENYSVFKDRAEKINRYSNGGNYENFQSSISPFFISDLLNSGSEVHFEHQFEQSEVYAHLRDKPISIEEDKENLLAPLVSFPKIDGTLVIEELLREN